MIVKTRLGEFPAREKAKAISVIEFTRDCTHYRKRRKVGELGCVSHKKVPRCRSHAGYACMGWGKVIGTFGMDGEELEIPKTWVEVK